MTGFASLIIKWSTIEPYVYLFVDGAYYLEDDGFIVGSVREYHETNFFFIVEE